VLLCPLVSLQQIAAQEFEQLEAREQHMGKVSFLAVCSYFATYCRPPMS
jgi:hypothetical protein